MEKSKQEKIFGKIFCINLDSRPERWTNFLQTMFDAHVEKELIERFPGIAVPGQGWLGCCRSHIAVMKKAIDEGYPRITFFQDDFVWKNPKTALIEVEKLIEDVERTESESWDVIMLAARLTKSENTSIAYLKRVRNALTATACIVERHYMKTLLKNFQEAEQLLIKHAQTLQQYQTTAKTCTLDQNWFKLQETDNWYVPIPTLGKQIDSMSDIVGYFVAHTYENV